VRSLGDEFIAVIDNISGPQDAADTSTRLLAAMAAPFQIDEHELLLSASVGISLHPEHGTELVTLQERADKAMYVAKSHGRNQFALFSTEVARREEVLQEIGRDLYRALPHGQFHLCYQPLVERSAEVVGFEALPALDTPGSRRDLAGGIYPDCRKIRLNRRYRGVGASGGMPQLYGVAARGAPPVGVAVNVSGVQFERTDFPDMVVGVLRDCGLEPGLLTLELTEGVLIRNVARACQHLAGLRQLGVRVALDDFGTGYSSLSYLATLPADIVKLDRSFVNREFANASAIVDSVIEMAHRIGLRVVAEGIETSKQSDRLLNMNCDEQQGFYFSAPVPAESVAEFLTSREAKNALAA
jgi:EAL domain-containing protein (putative c-di-GMP-specific phosphodiesterase class I)